MNPKKKASQPPPSLNGAYFAPRAARYTQKTVCPGCSPTRRCSTRKQIEGAHSRGGASGATRSQIHTQEGNRGEKKERKKRKEEKRNGRGSLWRNRRPGGPERKKTREEGRGEWEGTQRIAGCSGQEGGYFLKQIVLIYQLKYAKYCRTS